MAIPSGTVQSIVLFLANGALIFGIFVWSGSHNTQDSLWNRSISAFSGLEIPVSNYNNSVEFYTKVLGLTPISEEADIGDHQEKGFLLPQKRKLFLRLKSSNCQKISPSAESWCGVQLTIKVRHGFEKLHAELLARNGKQPQNVQPSEYQSEMMAGSLSVISSEEKNKQFVVCDPDRNLVVFQKVERLASQSL